MASPFRSLKPMVDRLERRKTLNAVTAQRRQARAEASEAARLERQLQLLVSAIPTKKAFDEWVETFPAEYQADIRLRFAPYCTFPQAGVSPSSPLAAGAGQTGQTVAVRASGPKVIEIREVPEAEGEA